VLLRVDPKFLHMDLRSLMEERALLEQETGDLLDELCGIYNELEEGNPAVEETVTSLLQARQRPHQNQHQPPQHHELTRGGVAQALCDERRQRLLLEEEYPELVEPAAQIVRHCSHRARPPTHVRGG
jgi:hypothetical protein